MRPSAPQCPGAILGPHPVDGLIAGRLALGVVELKLAGLIAEAAELDAQQAQPAAVACRSLSRAVAVS